jgi:hypothetical protein
VGVRNRIELDTPVIPTGQAGSGGLGCQDAAEKRNVALEGVIKVEKKCEGKHFRIGAAFQQREIMKSSGPREATTS